MTTRVVKIAKNTHEFSVKLPMDMCTLGNKFDKLSLSNIKYSIPQACNNRLRISYVRAYVFSLEYASACYELFQYIPSA